MALWGGRFESGASSMFKQVNDSLPFDQVMASQDIQGSISWSRALQKAGVLAVDEQAQLESALSQRKSPNSLYSEDFATFGADDVYDQKHAEGFIRLFSLSSRIDALKKQG